MQKSKKTIGAKTKLLKSANTNKSTKPKKRFAAKKVSTSSIQIREDLKQRIATRVKANSSTDQFCRFCEAALERALQSVPPPHAQWGLAQERFKRLLAHHKMKQGR